MNFTLPEHFRSLIGLVPAASIAARNGVAIDTQLGGMAVEVAEFLLSVGVITDGTVDFKIQQDDNSGFSSPTDIPGALITQFAATDDSKLAIICLVRGAWTERYLRCVVTGAGATGYVGGVTVKLWGPGQKPVIQHVDVKQTVILGS